MFTANEMEMLHLGHIYKTTTWDITGKAASWKDFLHYVSRFYHYSFENLVFMYAQNNNASMMATLADWYQMGRFVNPYQKGIVVFDYPDGRINNKYIFDISQTHGADVPRPWRIKQYMFAPLVERLNAQYDLTANAFPQCVKQVTRREIGKQCGTYLDKFTTVLEERNYRSEVIQKIRQDYFPLVKSSCLYIIAQRCGYGKRNDYHKSFGYIRDFNNPFFLSRLGTAVSDISSKVLSIVEKNVLELKEERLKSIEQGNGIKDAGRESRGNLPESAVLEQHSGRQAAFEVWDDGIQLSEGSSLSKIYRLLNGRDAHGEDAQHGTESGRDGKEPDLQYAKGESSAGRSGAEKTANGGIDAGGGENRRERDNMQGQVKNEENAIKGLPDGGSFLSAKIESQNETEEKTVSKSEKMQDALYDAIKEKDDTRVRKLLDSGASVQKMHNGTTPLHCAAQHGSDSCAKLLLKDGAYVDVIDNAQKTPLYYSVANSDIVMTKTLLDAGANPDLRAGNKKIREMPRSKEMRQLLDAYSPELNQTKGQSLGLV